MSLIPHLLTLSNFGKPSHKQKPQHKKSTTIHKPFSPFPHSTYILNTTTFPLRGRGHFANNMSMPFYPPKFSSS